MGCHISKWSVSVFIKPEFRQYLRVHDQRDDWKPHADYSRYFFGASGFSVGRMKE
jgi:hypothetical protein